MTGEFILCGHWISYQLSSILAAASNLPKLTAGIGLLAWLGVFLASSGLIFFYRCSRYPLENYSKFCDLCFMLLYMIISGLHCFLDVCFLIEFNLNIVKKKSRTRLNTVVVIIFIFSWLCQVLWFSLLVCYHYF